MRICRICGEEFTPAKNHPGYINVCLEPECRSKAREPIVEPLTACVSWNQKTLEIDIVADPTIAARHNRYRDRMGMRHLSMGNL